MSKGYILEMKVERFYPKEHYYVEVGLTAEDEKQAFKRAKGIVTMCQNVHKDAKYTLNKLEHNG